MTLSTFHNATLSRRLLAALCMFFCLAAFALGGCSSDDAITSPDEPAADAAFSLDALAADLHALTAAFEADLAAGRLAPAPPPLDFRKTQGVDYPFTNVRRDNLNAYVIGTYCPDIAQIDQARIIDVLALDQPLIDAMNTALATAGGTVTLAHRTHAGLSVGGNGETEYMRLVITAVRHATGGRTILDQVLDRLRGDAHVGLMAAGDVLVVAMLGVGYARTGGCRSSDVAILEWWRPGGGDPLVKVRL